MKNTIVVLIAILSTTAYAGSKDHKYQDGDYNKAVCQMLSGKTQVNLGVFGRADCVTDANAIETEYADLWQQGVNQAVRYGKGTQKKGMLAIIIENSGEQKFAEDAEKYIKEKNIDIKIRRYTIEDLKAHLPEKQICAKLSRSGNKCHLVNTGSYANTSNYVGFDSYAKCIRAGGDKPGGVGSAKLAANALEAYKNGICTDSNIN